MVAVVAAAVAVTGIGLQGSAPVAATPSVAQPTLARPTPTATTPHVTDGDVRTVAEVGNTVVLGGSFTRSTDPNGTVANRSYLLAFDKTTGQIRRDWIPRLDAEVFSVEAAADGKSVYVAGRFNTVNGVASAKVARIAISNGARLPFQSGFNGVVTTIALQGNRLFAGGVFTSAQGRARRVVALNASTGVIDDTMAVAFAGTHNGGEGKIWRIEPSRNGRSVMVVGSFKTAGGQARNQIAKLDTGATVTLSPWSTTAFSGICSGFTDYVRDVSFSPDSSYFVVATTGAKGSGVNGTCDSVSRWENTTTAGSRSSWVEYSGGDSYYSAEVTGSAVYVGGHMRYSNNSAGADSLGAGGSATTGIAALDPANGLPLSWNPGRTRGRAVWQLLSTSSGLYVASDTETIAGVRRARIAYFPLAGGKTVPQPARLTLPATLEQYVPAAGATAARVTRRGFDGTTAGAPQTAVANASALAGVNAAFWADGTLYTSHTDGTLRARSANGTSLGAATTVDLQRMTSFAADLRTMRSALYDQGRLYYTVAGSATLHMRYFSVENKVVGAQRFDIATSSGAVSYSNITGMIRSGNVVYFADLATGTLRKGTWRTAGGIDPATVVTVSAANAGGLSWTTTELWARPGPMAPPVPPTPPVNQAPVARVTVSCVALTCTFDASASTDADGRIASIDWEFGDDSDTGHALRMTHTYAKAGTYEVLAYVFDDDGDFDVRNPTITVSATAAAAPTARMTSYCSVSGCTFNGTGSTAASGSIASYTWEFGDGTTGTGATPTHAYAKTGTFTVRLTVTDSGGRTGTTTATVTNTTAAGSFVGKTTRLGATAKTHTVTAPATVKAGDQLLLFVSTNAAGGTSVATPAGWTRLLSGPASLSPNVVFSKVATAADAAKSVSVTLGTTAKADLVLAAYRGVRVASGGAAIAAGTVTPTRTALAGDWVVSYWADKSSATKGWTTPTGSVVRHNAVGSGGGRLAEALVDTGAGTTAGTRGGLTATQGASSTSRVAVTILLRKA